MNIVSISSVIELNKLLEQKALGIKIHLKDACGKQSMRIEALNGSPVSESAFELIDSFFKSEHMVTEYSADKTIFWIKN